MGGTGQPHREQCRQQVGSGAWITDNHEAQAIGDGIVLQRQQGGQTGEAQEEQSQQQARRPPSSSRRHGVPHVSVAMNPMAMEQHSVVVPVPAGPRPPLQPGPRFPSPHAPAQPLTTLPPSPPLLPPTPCGTRTRRQRPLVPFGGTPTTRTWWYAPATKWRGAAGGEGRKGWG